jgi:hypothetical protein
VDVGQRASKVYAFCLVEARAGAVSVSFERGAWRPLLEGAAWPKGDAGVFEDLGRESRLSETAERCALTILDRSPELVVRWRTLSRATRLSSRLHASTRRLGSRVRARASARPSGAARDVSLLGDEGAIVAPRVSSAFETRRPRIHRIRGRDVTFR